VNNEQLWRIFASEIFNFDDGEARMSIFMIMAQIVGVILIIVCAIAPQMKTRSGMLFMSLIGNSLWILQFVLVGAMNGALTGCVSIVRTGIFYFYARFDKKAPIWVLILLMLAMIGVNAYKWNGWLSIILMFGVANVYGQWQEKKQVMRATLLWTTIFNGIYCLVTGAWTGAVNEFVQTVSASVALWRFRKQRTTNSEQ